MPENSAGYLPTVIGFVAGMSMWRMPKSESASTTAFITLVSEPAQPASPQPLAPSKLVVAGTG